MIMKVEKEMKYEAPKVEVLKVEVELGFAASGIEGPRSEEHTSELQSR